MADKVPESTEAESEQLMKWSNQYWSKGIALGTAAGLFVVMGVDQAIYTSQQGLGGALITLPILGMAMKASSAFAQFAKESFRKSDKLKEQANELSNG